jgi:hypothetical protein
MNNTMKKRLIRLTEAKLQSIVERVISESSEINIDMSSVERKIKSLVKEYHTLKKDFEEYGGNDDEERMREIEFILKSIGLKKWK